MIITSSSLTLSAQKSRRAASSTEIETSTFPSLFILPIHPAKISPALPRRADSVSGRDSYAKYHNNRSKLLEIKISIAGLSVSFTPLASVACFPSDDPAAGSNDGAVESSTEEDESTFSYFPVFQNRARMSLALVATPNLAVIGRPIFLA